jgi:5-methylcytosine-specific restriction endonuclease McrA
MPIDYARYGPEWPAISRRIRERAGNRCERCGVANYAVGARDRTDVWHDEAAMHRMNSTEGFMLWPEGFPRVIRIVLTVHHMDGNPDSHDESRLQALCQRCHLQADGKLRAAHARVTRIEKRGGQLPLPLVEVTH